VARLLIKAPRLLDGNGHPPVQDAALLIDGDKIVFAGEAKAAPVDPSAQVLTYDDCTIMPGLIDSHVHLSYTASNDPFADMASMTGTHVALQAAKNGWDALRIGVTTVRDLGSNGTTLFEFRDAAKKGLATTPRILASGDLISRTGAGTYGRADDGPWQIRTKIRQLCGQGADVIKVVATYGFGGAGIEPYVPAYTDEELAAAIDETHRLGRLITVHVTGVEGIRQAMRLGVDGMEHFPMMVGPYQWGWDEELAQQVREKGIWVTATISAGYRRDEWEKAGAHVVPRPGRLPLARRMENLRKMVEARLDLVVGTDSGGTALGWFDDSVPVEMETFVEAGMQPVDAVAAATGRCAAAIGMKDTIGSLNEGKIADILVVQGDPSRTISDVRLVRAVFTGGQEVDRSRFWPPRDRGPSSNPNWVG
jgi:imidazolonepropionase-like amidohydrolase